ncbi:MAG: hypothetical protein GW949_05075 [Spirochaetales bacterium]|nr:hypothetical protein [Spirochaetales bacterium]
MVRVAAIIEIELPETIHFLDRNILRLCGAQQNDWSYSGVALSVDKDNATPGGITLARMARGGRNGARAVGTIQLSELALSLGIQRFQRA